jgi:hypothetical protein
MKRSFIILTGIMMFCILGFAQNTNKPPVNPNAPEMKFDSLTHDYGTIMEDANGDCEFKFKNIGEEPLIITSVTSSCGCTTPYWCKEPILPGKTDVIKVHYSTNKIGVISKQITVISNAKNSPVVLNIKGNVLKKPIVNAPDKITNPTNTPINTNNK